MLAYAKSFSQFGFCSPGSSLNLVCNPGFEYYISCPQHLSQLNQAYGWYVSGDDPDFFHASTAGTEVAIPQNIYGYQYPNSGNGMAGLGSYERVSPSNLNCGLEYIGTKLIDTLEIGQKYYLSFYVSFAEMLKGYQKIATNKMGMRFSTKPTGGWAGRPALNNSAHLYANTILSDTLSWVHISGSFIADSAYSHLTIGNFFDYLNVDTLLVGSPVIYGRSWSYYYLDDVCVSKDSLTCSSIVGIREQDRPSLSCIIYPNPAESEITLQTDKEGTFDFLIFNLLGEEILSRRFSRKAKIDVSSLSNGTYLYLIKEDQIISKADKLIIAR